MDSERMGTSLASLKPIIGMLAVNLGYAGMNIIARVAMDEGMNHFVFVPYKEAVATMAIAPFAYFLERSECDELFMFCRNSRPVLTCSIFCRIFVLAISGITAFQNFYFGGLRDTSATFATAISNIIPVFVFLMATATGTEKVDMKSKYGQAKVVGTIVCVSGAMIMTFYKGPVLLAAPHGHTLNTWILGAIMLFVGCLFMSGWYTFQAPVVRKYPAQLSLTTIMLFQGTVLSFLVALLFEPKASAWMLKWDIQLLSILFSGLCSSFAFFVKMYCIRVKGPIFVVMFLPTTTVMVAILEHAIFHLKFHLGSLSGSIFIITGLFTVLWGKAKDHNLDRGGSNKSSDMKQSLLQDDSSQKPQGV